MPGHFSWASAFGSSPSPATFLPLTYGVGLIHFLGGDAILGATAQRRPGDRPRGIPARRGAGSAAAPRPLGGPLVVRATVIWFAILVLASLNGAVRDLVMAPRIGDTIARAISTVVLCALIVLVTWLSIRWIGPGDAREALEIGALWLVLTLLFEFGAGHYLSHKPWAEVLADYNVLRGRIWVLVPFVTFFAPLWAGHARDLW